MTGKKDFLEKILLGLFIFIVVSAVIVIFRYDSGVFSYDKYDYLEGIKWVQSTVNSKALVGNNFIYAYIVVLGSNVLFIPFYLLFGVSLITNQLGMLLYYAIFLIVLYYLAKSLFENKKKQYIFLIFNNLFIYTYTGENLLHHILFYGIGYLCLIGEFAAVINILRNKNFKMNSILLIIFVLWSSINGVTLVFSNVPLIFSLLVFTLVKWIKKRKIDKNYIYLFVLIMLGTLIGFVIYFLLTRNALTTGSLGDRFKFNDIEKIISNLLSLKDDYLLNFYGYFYEINLNSTHGFINIFSFLISSVLLIVAFLSVKLYKDNNYQLLALASLAVIGVCVLEYLLTSHQNCRYLFNGILCLYLLSSYYLTSINQKHYKYLLLFTCTIVSLLSIRMAYDFRNDLNVLKVDKDICQIIEDKNAHFGLAKYIADYYVLSNGDINGLTYSYDKGEPVIENVEVSIINPKFEKNENVFVIISNKMKYKLEESSIYQYKEDIIEYEDYTIVFFNNKYWNQIIEGGLYE